MAAMTGQRAGNTLGGRAVLCGASDWLPAETHNMGNSTLAYRSASAIKQAQMVLSDPPPIPC